VAAVGRTSQVLGEKSWELSQARTELEVLKSNKTRGGKGSIGVPYCHGEIWDRDQEKGSGGNVPCRGLTITFETHQNQEG